MAPAPRLLWAQFDFFGILLVIVIVVIIYQIIRTLSGPARQTPPPPGRRPWPPTLPPAGGQGTQVRVEPMADGFWIDPIGYPPGSVVHYRYHVFGVPRQSTAVVETGGRQFIYTGDTPTDVVVTQIVPPGGVQPLPGQPSIWPIPVPPIGGATPGVSGFPSSRPAMPADEPAGAGGSFGDEAAPSTPAPSSPPGGYPSAY
jgi:hypothetical protein